MTTKERLVYKEMVTYYKENKYLPTMRELQEKLGYKSINSIYKIIVSLEKQGYLTRENKKRKIILTNNYDIYNNDVINVTVLNTNENFIMDLNKNKNYCGFKIKNDYFKDLYIKNGDYLIIENCHKLKNGELGLFNIYDNYRIMKYNYKDGFFILKDNKCEIVYKVKIIGKVIGIYRTSIF